MRIVYTCLVALAMCMSFETSIFVVVMVSTIVLLVTAIRAQ